MSEPSRLYVSISTDIELEVVVTAREYNGIDSDPRVRLRQPTLEELQGCLADVKAGDFRFFKDLDFPEEVRGEGTSNIERETSNIEGGEV